MISLHSASIASRRARATGGTRALGTQLNADAVLRGQFTYRGNRVIVHAALGNVADNRELWSQSFDVAADSLAQIEHSIAVGVATALGVNRDRVRARRVDDPLAYDLYLRGRSVFNAWDEATLPQASLLFREAIKRDSGMARAYVGLADVYMATQSAPPADRFALAKPLVARALALDSGLAEAHKAAGWIAMWYDHDWLGAERHLERALALDPSEIWTYHSYAALLAAVGRSDESVAITRRAMPLDPAGAATRTHLAMHLYWRGHVTEAIEMLEDVLATDTTWVRAHAVLGRAYLAVGRYEDAIRELRHDGPEYASIEPRGVLINALAAGGRTREARVLLARLERRARVSHVGAINFVAGYVGLGDTARALDWAEKIPDDRGTMQFLYTEPMFAPLRGSPRFQRVLDRLGLPDAARRMGGVRDIVRNR